MTKWFLAKYVRDLRRGEPRNVGVVLFSEGRAYARFLAEDEDGRIDGRSIRMLGSSDNYRAWVRRWRRDLKLVSTEKEFAALAQVRPASNYYLSPSGETRVPVRNVQAFLSGLFAELVDPLDESREIDHEGLVQVDPFDAVFDMLGILEQVETGVWLRDAEGKDKIFFDRKYSNGSDHYFRLLNPPALKQNSWDLVHAVAWNTKRLQHEYKGHPRKATSVALVGGVRPMDVDQLECLRESGTTTVEVHNPAMAVASLRTELHLAS